MHPVRKETESPMGQLSPDSAAKGPLACVGQQWLPAAPEHTAGKATVPRG